uniref:Uncharacterized protein n=1 Tax=Photinus pyralis TaxID=7054 RepID=A0A1Y1KA15_PHOPY
MLVLSLCHKREKELQEAPLETYRGELTVRALRLHDDHSRKPEDTLAEAQNVEEFRVRVLQVSNLCLEVPEAASLNAQELEGVSVFRRNYETFLSHRMSASFVNSIKN